MLDDGGVGCEKWAHTAIVELPAAPTLTAINCCEIKDFSKFEKVVKDDRKQE